MTKIYDGIISENLQNRICEHFFSPEANWQYCHATCDPISNIFPKNILESFQFVAQIKDDTNGIYDYPTYGTILELFKEIQKKTQILLLDPFRVKFNLITNNPNANKLSHHTPHVDAAGFNHYVLIYYVEDSDGDTIMFKETQKNIPFNEASSVKEFTIKERIQPKKGRFILFDGDQYHTSCSPQKHLSRSVININFKKDNVLM